jgi:hypothetical protein
MAGSVHETKIAQTAAIKLELLKPLSLEQTLLLVYRINSFLCFAFDQPSALIAVSILPLGVTQTRPKAKNEKREADTQLFYASLPQSEEPPDLTGFRQLLPFAGIEKIFGKLLSAWLAEYDTVEPALEAYLLATTVQHARLETKFLILVQGLETLHRRSSEATTMSQQEFDQILAGLLSACPSNHKDWLKTRLKYANELSLRHRLRALCSPFVNLLAPQNVGKLIDDILNTRNYLTHFDKSLEAAAKSGVDLWSLCDKLEVIFKFQILRKLNFTDQEIRSIPATNSDIARKLGLLT